MKNTLKIILLCVCLIVNSLVMGCAAGKIKELRPGMTKAEVEAILGKPTGYLGGPGPTEMYEYNNLAILEGSVDYDLWFVNGKLIEWGQYSFRPPPGQAVVGTGVIFPPPNTRY